MKPVIREELLDYVTWTEQRPIARPQILAAKELRRVQVDSCFTFLFENRDTGWAVVHFETDDGGLVTVVGPLALHTTEAPEPSSGHALDRPRSTRATPSSFLCTRDYRCRGYRTCG